MEAGTGTTTTLPFSVDLGFFSGPMDLLLHLVRRQEVAIEELKLSCVAEQYLEIIRAAQRLDLDLAAEYLVVAATLVAIKSERLLPDWQRSELAEEEHSEEFYAELRERLRRYEEVKKQALGLRSRPQLDVDIFSRRPPLGDPLIRREVNYEVFDDGHSLGMLFTKLLKRIGALAQTLRVALSPISVVDYMMRVLDGIGEGGAKQGGFFSLVRRFAGRASSADRRATIIGSLLAVLELAKRGVLQVSQAADQAEITLSLGESEESVEAGREQGEARESSEMAVEVTTVENVVPFVRRRAAGEDREIDEQESSVTEHDVPVWSAIEGDELREANRD